MSDLSSWCLRHYEVPHDFAAPVATVIAAGVAVFVTWKLGRRQVPIAAQQAKTAELQAATAKQQADTALDRLRYDLFEKRYAIYSTAKELMRSLVNQGQAEKLDEIAVTEKLVFIEECVFFFPRVHVPSLLGFEPTLIGFLNCGR